MEWFTWIIGYWSVLAWAVPILAVVILVQHLFGRTFSLPLGLLGGLIIAFMIGKKIERDNQRKYVQDIQEKRDEAYEKIDNRDTDESDVTDRLRQGDF